MAVAVCATTAFWGQCQLGKLLPSSPSPLLSASLPTCSYFKRLIQNPLLCILHLPSTKTHRHGQDIILINQHTLIDPISLLKSHIQVNTVSSNQYIFSFTLPDGCLLLSKPLFLQCCNNIWIALGYPHTTGHCFCIGGTTELLIASTPLDMVKATKHWSSESFLYYWCTLNALTPQHIRNIHAFKCRYK
jgi:hypothetical protein